MMYWKKKKTSGIYLHGYFWWWFEFILANDDFMDEYFNFRCIKCGTCCKRSLVSMTYFEYLRLKELADKLGKICVFYIYKNHVGDWVILLSAKPE